MAIEDFARRLPKAELHIHLEGAVRPDTFAALAARNGVALPAVTHITDLYRYDDLPSFLTVYDLVSRSIVRAEDFHRITYEMLEGCAGSGARYCEFFFSPHAHQAYGVRYETMLDGIRAGMRDAGTDHAIFSRVIPAHSRELGPARGMAFLDTVLAHRGEDVIGIGLDYNEAPFPPAPFAPMYARAAAAGLHVTAHAGEGGPASYVRDSLDCLRVERIDHGYHVVDDPALVARCRAAGTPFTCCPTTTLTTTVWRDLAAPDHAIRRMIEAGLLVTINSDDPPMLGTDLAGEYVRCAHEMGLSAETLARLALNAIDASWLDDATKRAWRTEWRAAIEALAVETLDGPLAPGWAP